MINKAGGSNFCLCLPPTLHINTHTLGQLFKLRELTSVHGHYQFERSAVDINKLIHPFIFSVN